MEHWVQWLDQDGLSYPPIVRAALAHETFLAIHPFSDGNGHTARLLWHQRVEGKQVGRRSYTSIAAVQHYRAEVAQRLNPPDRPRKRRPAG